MCTGVANTSGAYVRIGKKDEDHVGAFERPSMLSFAVAGIKYLSRLAAKTWLSLSVTNQTALLFRIKQCSRDATTHELQACPWKPQIPSGRLLRGAT